MKVEQVYRVKGTVLVGKLDGPLCVGKEVQIITRERIVVSRVIGIICDTPFQNPVDFAEKYQNVCVIFRGIADVTIQPGDTVVE